MISIIIPVYKESCLLEDLILFLKKDQLKKEIIIPVDCPTKKTKQVLSKLKGIKVLYSKKRRGKFHSCNLAVERAKSDKIIFLDDDVILGKNVLKEISKALDKADLVEVKKEVVIDNIKSRISYAEYVINYIAIDLISKNTTYGLVNGAAFGVRKKAFEKIGGMKNCLTEDVEFSLRFTKKCKFKFLRNTKVMTKIDERTDFWEQRKRWIFGTLMAMERHPGASKKMMFFNPILTLAWLLVSIPSLFWLPVLLLFPFPILFLGMIFLMSFVLYWHYGKNLDYSIEIKDYLLYFFIGSIIRLILIVYGKIVCIFFPDKIKGIDDGWVVK